MIAPKQLVTALAPITDRVHRGHCWRRTPDGPRRIPEALDEFKIAQHVAGRAAYGVCPIAPGSNTTRLALLDFDDHDGRMLEEAMEAIVLEVIEQALNHHLTPIPFRSSGGKGVHLFFLWDEPQDAYSVRQLLTDVLADSLLTPGTGGVVKSQVEVFPKQDSVPADGFGSMFILPFAGKSEPLAVTTLDVIDRSAVIWPTSQPVPVREKPVREATAVETPELAQLRAALDAIPNNEMESLDYDQWRNIVFAIHHATDGSDAGLHLAQEFSARSPKHDTDFLESRVWPYIRNDRDNGITARTIFAKAREYGYEEPVEDDFEVLPPETSVTGGISTSSGVTGDQGVRFKVLSAGAFTHLPPPTWVIKNVLLKAELAVVYGESGSGKSFFALDIGGAVARGIDWRGHKTKQGRVIFIVAEGQGGFRNRLKAYAEQHQLDLDQLGIGVIGDAPNFLRTDDIKAVIAAVKAWGPADLIFVDTLARVTPGANENAGEDMGKAINHCERLHAATGAMVVLIHHAGKDLTKGARGWSGIKGALDTEIEINRLDQDRWARVSKLKDGEGEGAEFPFRLHRVVIGRDEDGDEITSCTIEHTEARATGPKQPTGTKNLMVWRLIHELTEVGDAVVAEKVIVDEVVRRLPRGDSQKDQRPYIARRAIENLTEQGFVVVLDGLVRLAGTEANSQETTS